MFEAKQEFEKCGKLIKSEMGRFEEERIRDFKLALESFVEGMISRQKVVCHTLLSLFPSLFLIENGH